MTGLRHAGGRRGRTSRPGGGRRRRRARGYSFVELLVVSAILLILASAVAPLAHVSVQRHRETELRRALREIRLAIDRYKDAVDGGVIGGPDLDPDHRGYPPDLETLVDGVAPVDDRAGGVLRFLRRIPVDPMTRSTAWGLRAYDDAPDTRRWGGGNVYDVYSTAPGAALDGTRYRDW